MPDAVTALAAAFPPPDRAAWLAQVEKTLKGAGADTLVSHTADGVEIQPLYGESDATALPSWRRRHGERAWEVRSEVDLADPALANSLLLAELAGGADSVRGRLTGVRGQYWILGDGRVLNVRRHTGYEVVLRA